MEISLLERNYGGILVSILWHPETETLSLLVKEGEYDPFYATLEGSQVSDAFSHPYCYLSKEDIEESRNRRRELVLA